MNDTAEILGFLMEASKRIGRVKGVGGKKIDVLKELLKKPRIKWAVMGGVAAMFWGARSMPTIDLDLIGNAQTLKYLKEILGEPVIKDSVILWNPHSADEVNMVYAREPFFKYMLDTAHKTPKMRIVSRVGVALGKLAAVNSLYRIYNKKNKGQQDIADLLNLIKGMKGSEKKEFMDAAKKTLKQFPYAVSDAEKALKYVKDGEATEISSFSLPTRKQ